MKFKEAPTTFATAFSLACQLIATTVVANTPRADIIIRLGEAAFRYGTKLGLERGRQIVMETQPLKAMIQDTEHVKLSDNVVTELELNPDRSHVDFLEKTVTLKVFADKVTVKSRYLLKDLDAPGDVDVSVNDLTFSLAIGVSASADELIPFLQSEPACDVQLGEVKTSFHSDPGARCGGGFLCRVGLSVSGVATVDDFAAIGATIVAPAIFKDKLGPAVCSMVKGKLMPSLNKLLDEAKQALVNASISVPIARDVKMGIAQKGSRSVKNGILSIPLALTFRYGSPELTERAKVITGIIDQCPPSDDSIIGSPAAETNMLAITFTRSFLQDLIGVIMTTDIGSFNELSEQVGKYLSIDNCTESACLPALLGLDPKSDPHLNDSRAGLECKIEGDVENAKEVCASTFSVYDNGVSAVMPLKIHCTVPLNNSAEVLDVLRSHVLIKVEIADIRMTSSKIFVNESSEITLAASFNNSELFYKSKNVRFSAPTPEGMSEALEMVWANAEGQVIKFLKAELAKGIEIPPLGPVSIVEASILVGDAALENGVDEITAVADVMLNI